MSCTLHYQTIIEVVIVLILKILYYHGNKENYLFFMTGVNVVRNARD
jgi:hypothetical protein